MAELDQAQFEQLPDFIKGEYEQVGEVYRSKAEGKAASLKASLDALDGKFKTTDAQLKEILAKSAEDRTKAEETALERLKKEGKFDEVIADVTRRKDETINEFKERIDKLLLNSKQDKRSAIKADLISKYSTDDGRETFEELLERHIDYDPETGKEIYLNADGSASSLDRAGFEAEIQKMKKFQPVLKAAINKGGDAKGGSGGGADKQGPVNEKAELAKKNGDLSSYLNAKLSK